MMNQWSVGGEKEAARLEATNYTEIEHRDWEWNNNFCHLGAVQLVECLLQSSMVSTTTMMIRGKWRREENWKVPLKCKADGWIIFCRLNGEICAQKIENAYEQQENERFSWSDSHWNVCISDREGAMNNELIKSPAHMRDWTWQNVTRCLDLNHRRSVWRLAFPGLILSPRTRWSNEITLPIASISMR